MRGWLHHINSIQLQPTHKSLRRLCATAVDDHQLDSRTSSLGHPSVGVSTRLFYESIFCLSLDRDYRPESLRLKRTKHQGALPPSVLVSVALEYIPKQECVAGSHTTFVELKLRIFPPISRCLLPLSVPHPVGIADCQILPLSTGVLQGLPLMQAIRVVALKLVQESRITCTVHATPHAVTTGLMQFAPLQVLCDMDSVNPTCILGFICQTVMVYLFPSAYDAPVRA